jgi:hypothetical protein
LPIGFMPKLGRNLFRLLDFPHPKFRHFVGGEIEPIGVARRVGWWIRENFRLDPRLIETGPADRVPIQP